MKTIIIFNLFILIASSLQAQQKDESIKPFDTSVLKLAKPKLTFLYNNNQFDICTTTPDNMYVIKPDSSNHFNMPVKKYDIIQTEIKPKDSDQ